MSKIVITGATGFIGSNLIRVLLQFGHEVIAIVRDEKKIPVEFINYSKFQYFGCELSNVSKLKSSIFENTDVLYHLAWDGASGNKRSSVSLQLDNIKNSIEVYRFAIDKNIKKFVSIGTIAENFTETKDISLIKTRNFIYPLSKKYLQGILLNFSNSEPISTIWCTLCGVYGESDTTDNIVNKTIINLLNNETPKFGPATQWFDFVHINDCIKALYLIGMNHNTSNHYYIGSGNPRKLRFYLEIIKQKINPDVVMQYGYYEDDGVHYKKEWFNINNLVADFNFKPEIDFTDGIERILHSRKTR